MTAAPEVSGVCFTGSTATAQAINRSMAAHMAPTAPLIAETGGLNAMIVDSTALPEQAIRDIVASSFQSAGQRCSALRVLYMQEDVADSFLKMLYGVMDALHIGDPWDLRADLGPVIDKRAKDGIMGHINKARAEGRVLKDVASPDQGTFVPPTVISVKGIGDLEEEIFGPVLHVARFAAEDLDRVIAAINGTGYGLTFGIHTRIDDRVTDVTQKLLVGNIYVNRNQIGAVVESQPFGGEGLSGTGPKAGGPDYVPRFTDPGRDAITMSEAAPVDAQTLATALRGLGGATPCLSSTTLPGPTGESNVLSVFGRGTVLCLGPGRDAALAQAQVAQDNGCRTLCVARGLRAVEGLDGVVAPADLALLEGIDVVALQADEAALRPYRVALAGRAGKLIPLVAEADIAKRCQLERHICIDTTAAGGNATLLAEV